MAERVISCFAAFGALLGGLDYVCGGRLGLGDRFVEGLRLMSSLALSMIGIYCLAPLLVQVLRPVAAPLAHTIGADPSIVAAVLSTDMGGYPLAAQIAENEQAGAFSGIVLTSMLGSTISFSIPVGMGMIAKKHVEPFLQGILAGLITLPVGALVGGLAARLPLYVILPNLLPVAMLAVVIAVGLKLRPALVVHVLGGFGKGVALLSAAGLALAAAQTLSGVTLVPGLAPVEEAFSVVSSIGLMLLGVLPVITLARRVLRVPLRGLGRLTGLSSFDLTGLLVCTASAVPVFSMVDEMSPRGIAVNGAWMVSACCVCSSLMSFTARVLPEMLPAMLTAKTAGGVLAVGVIFWTTRKTA